MAHLRAHAPEGAIPDVALREMQTNELYLACACAQGDEPAIAWFESRCLSVIDEALPSMAGMDPHTIDDVKQRLRHRLLVFDDRPPRILDYSGRGSLRGWLRTLAVREALSLTRRSRRESPSSTEQLEAALTPAANPEHEYFKRFYQGEFTTALTEAMLNLRPKERTLLRQSLVDGLSLDDIGRLYHVHRATAARWLARARQALSRQTRVILSGRLRVEPVELHNILHLIRSGLHVSLRLLFPRTGRQHHEPAAKGLRWTDGPRER